MPEHGLFIANAMHTPTKRLGLKAMTVPANVARFLFEISNENEPIHVVRFDMQESLSTLYAFNLTVAVENGSVKPSEWLGISGCITLADNVTPRVFHGEIVAVKQSDPGRRLTQYLVTLAPRFWYLQHRSGCRIFQEKSVPDIISQVFSEANITNSDYRFELQKTYSLREFCVQYQESEFHFLSRLMEEEGLFYFFEHTASKHVMVICDENKSFKPQANDHRIPYHPKTSMRPDRSIIYQVSSRRQVVANSVTVKDFNFEKTHLTLDAEVTNPNHDKLEHYVYPGGFESPGKGKQYASSMNDASLVRRETISGKTDDNWMSVGRTFDLVEHENDKFNAKYLVIGANYLGEQPQSLEEGAANSGSSYHTKFNAIPAAVTYKAEIVHKKKTIDGAQSAFVTGPPGEEIYTDEYGRVKVQFHWDREGQYNENASCWVRVNQGWAGNEWGSVTLPRVGQEVLVSFVDGDPDRPLVVGVLYNSVNKTPISLPSNKSRTTFKSHSYPGGGGYNELTIEDKKGSEKLNIHAQKDMDLYVQNDLKEIVENDQHDTVSKSLSAEIGQNLNQSIGKSANHKIGKTLSNTIGKDVNIKVTGSLMAQAGKDIHVKAGTKIVLQSGTQLTLKGGAGFIVLNPAGVVIKGPMVKINSGGSAGSAGGASPEAPADPEVPEKSKTGKNIKVKPAETPHQSTKINFVNGAVQPITLDKPQSNQQPFRRVEDYTTKISQVTSADEDQHTNVAPKLVASAQTTHFVDLVFQYQDGAPVANGLYKLTDSKGEVREGLLDSSGHARLDGLPSGEVWVDFMDPDEEPSFEDDSNKNPEYQPSISGEQLVNKSKGQNAGFWEASYNSLAEAINDVGETLAEVKSWTWGVLQGDFNENPTTAQIVTNAAVTMLPIVDQIGDVRDLAANILKLTDDKEQNDTEAWIALVITLVCCVPVLGSALKGVFKYVMKKGGSVTKEALFAIVRALGRGNPEKFLKNIDWSEITLTCQNHFKDIIEKSLEALHMLRQAMERIGNQEWLQGANQLYSKLDNLKSVGNQKIADAVNEIKNKVLRTLDDVPVVKRVRGSVDGKVSAKADEYKRSYTRDPSVAEPLTGETIHKRLHSDGSDGDTFTGLADGKPLGAIEGNVPKQTRGLKKLPENHDELVEDGWPNLNFEYAPGKKAGDYKNFSDAKAVTIPPGTKIYRIIDEKSNPAGAYWAYELPKNKSEWRGDYAVKDSWNDNGYYVEHVVEDDGLKVWEGTVAGQKYLSSEYCLPGGGKQIFISPNSIETSPPKLTGWEE